MELTTLISEIERPLLPPILLTHSAGLFHFLILAQVTLLKLSTAQVTSPKPAMHIIGFST
jgi:hypothetical protein